MKVKALKEHNNQFGVNFEKKMGDVYEHRSPAGDLAAKMIVEADPEAKLTAKRVAKPAPVEKAEVTKKS